MAAYRDKVYNARVTVTSLYGSLQERIYGPMLIVRSLYGTLPGQSLWCKGKCNYVLWQLTGTGFIVQK